MKKKGYEIEELVFRTFMKHVKANKLYLPFRWSVNHNNAFRDIVHQISQRSCDSYYNTVRNSCKVGSAFTQAKSVEDIINIMRDCNGGHKLEVAEDSKFQMEVMNMVNNLVHSCVEPYVGRNFEILEKIGSTVFEECCKALLGDSFKDMTEEAMAPEQRVFMKKMAEMGMPPIEHLNEDFLRMLHEHMERRRNRDISRSRWEEMPTVNDYVLTDSSNFSPNFYDTSRYVNYDDDLY